MTKAIVTHNQNALTTEQQNERLRQAAAVADKFASANAFEDFRSKKSSNTLRAHDTDLMSFADFLHTSGITSAPIEDLNTNPQSWQEITYGLLETYKLMMLNEGYAIGTINRRLSTIRKYAKLAYKADVMSIEQISKIKFVSGYSKNEASNVDEKREQTRITDDEGNARKKADSVEIGIADVARLKHEHDTNTPIGRRNRAIMCVLLEHGLRASEVSLMTVDNVNLDEGKMTFYRPKTKQTDTHKLTADSIKALSEYIRLDRPESTDVPLFVSGKRNGELKANGISTRTVTRIVNEAGNSIGIERLSAHDCRHSWATRASEESPIEAVKQGGGWASYAMLSRYIDKRKIANEGVILNS